MDSEAVNLLELNTKLLNSIVAADWAAYEKLCDSSITALEPEAAGQLIEGLGFHRFYFDLGAATGPRNTSMVRPHVRIMGDVAVISYIRLNQRLDAAGNPITAAIAETRVWQRQDGKWKHVHFHRG